MWYYNFNLTEEGNLFMSRLSGGLTTAKMRNSVHAQAARRGSIGYLEQSAKEIALKEEERLRGLLNFRAFALAYQAENKSKNSL